MKAKILSLLETPERIAVIILLFFGLSSTFLMPLLAIPDENQHFQVEYVIFSSKKQPSNDIVLSEEMILKSTKNGNYDDYFLNKTQADFDNYRINTNASAFGGASATVFDIMRLPQAIGVALGRAIYPSIASMVLMGRIINLLVYVAAIYLIIKYVRYGKWVFMYIACLPIMVQQAASLSYDSTNLLIIFAWVAFVINILTQSHTITRNQKYIGLGLIALLFLSKQNNLLLLGLIFAIPIFSISKNKTFIGLNKLKYKNIIICILFIIFSIIATLILYTLGQALVGKTNFHPQRLSEVIINTFLLGDLGLIDVTVKGMVGVFSNFYYGLPMWLVVISFVILVLSMLYDKAPNISKRFAMISIILFLSSILLISIGMYYKWAIRPERLGPNASITDGIQGRYFTPLLILLYPFFAYIQKYIKVTTSNKYFMPSLLSSTSIFLLCVYMLQTWNFFWK